MCRSDNDYCIPAFIDRENDYRGCGECYRAGSIFSNASAKSACTSCGSVGAEDITFFASNAGNYGITMPVGATSSQAGDFNVRPGHLTNPKRNQQFQRQPQNTQEEDYPLTDPSIVVPQDDLKTIPTQPRQPITDFDDDPFKNRLPTVEELLNEGTNPSQPLKPRRQQQSAPITPPSSLKVPETFETSASQDDFEALPVVPADAAPAVQNQYYPQSATGEPVITVEELWKIDPTATDIKILNVEDRAVE
ncbi:hypothetical protein FACS189454_09530 [Planctomycetales bacterium]|nr:hypothetical protein FACS189454_09530 [Planctomycetales bacterium]